MTVLDFGGRLIKNRTYTLSPQNLLFSHPKLRIEMDSPVMNLLAVLESDIYPAVIGSATNGWQQITEKKQYC